MHVVTWFYSRRLSARSIARRDNLARRCIPGSGTAIGSAQAAGATSTTQPVRCPACGPDGSAMNQYGFVRITCVSPRTAVADPSANAAEIVRMLGAGAR